MSKDHTNEMTTQEALDTAGQPNAKRRKMLRALGVLVRDQGENMIWQETHFQQAPNVGPALTALKNRLFGMGEQCAMAARSVLASHPATLSCYPELVQEMSIQGAGESNGFTGQPSRQEILDCMVCDGGSMDGFDPDWRAWVEDSADPKDVKAVKEQLRNNEELWLRLR
ncbi:MAG: hypothetical protein PHX93_03975 [Candidatus Peribacteraceae bacterium]|jgi:hypothetical protein|nr:hypothetical protein [Candidatus Peribacteraceae bacterium]